MGTQTASQQRNVTTYILSSVMASGTTGMRSKEHSYSQTLETTFQLIRRVELILSRSPV